MNWQMVILLNILIYTIAVALIKLAANKLPRTQGLCWQYLFCAIYVWGYRLLINQNITFSSADLIVLAIGFFNCFGAYLQWRAIKIHLSKTTLYDPLSEVITISLATIFLSEFKAWNFSLVLGMALSFSSFYLFYLKRVSEFKEWTVCTIGMFVITGIVTFLMKVFASVVKMPNNEFLSFWYSGALLATFPLLCLEKQKLFSYPGKIIFITPLLALTIIGNLLTLYWVFELTEVSRTMPIRLVGELIVPVSVGLFLFKERKGLSRVEILAFLIAIAGALSIIFS